MQEISKASRKRGGRELAIWPRKTPFAQGVTKMSTCSEKDKKRAEGVRKARTRGLNNGKTDVFRPRAARVPNVDSTRGKWNTSRYLFRPMRGCPVSPSNVGCTCFNIAIQRRPPIAIFLPNLRIFQRLHRIHNVQSSFHAVENWSWETRRYEKDTNSVPAFKCTS